MFEVVEWYSQYREIPLGSKHEDDIRNVVYYTPANPLRETDVELDIKSKQAIRNSNPFVLHKSEFNELFLVKLDSYQREHEIQHLAHMIWLETSGRIPWSTDVYNTEELDLILSYPAKSHTDSCSLDLFYPSMATLVVRVALVS